MDMFEKASIEKPLKGLNTDTILPSSGFIQASLSKVGGLSRTSKDYPTVFKD